MQDTTEFSDSDDDLLGITDSPVLIRHKIQKHLSPSRNLGPNHNIDSCSIETDNRRGITSYRSGSDRRAPTDSNDGWIHYKRHRKNKSPREVRVPPVMKLPQLNHKNDRYLWLTQSMNDDHIASPRTAPVNTLLTVDDEHYEDGENSGNFHYDGYNLCEMKDSVSNHINGSSFLSANSIRLGKPKNGVDFISNGKAVGQMPTMEIIDFNRSKQNKYQRMREIHNITGFIVNVHDATNFDIDLEIPGELHERYRDVISNQYTYQDLGDDFLENPDLNRTNQITPRVGTTYRCRLRGVGINQLSANTHTWKSNQMCIEIKQLIDRTDGWITCTLSDIDVYQRLLVDIIINTCQGPINLRDYLLSRMDTEENPIFYAYSGKSNYNKLILRSS